MLHERNAFGLGESAGETITASQVDSHSASVMSASSIRKTRNQAAESAGSSAD